jgi:hypothetical protein
MEYLNFFFEFIAFSGIVFHEDFNYFYRIKKKCQKKVMEERKVIDRFLKKFYMQKKNQRSRIIIIDFL